MHFDSHSTEVCSQVSNWQQSSVGSDTRSSPTLQWRHNERDGVSNHQPHQCLPNRLFRRRSKKTSKLRVTGLCAENSPATGEFPARMTSNAENVSIWWRLRGAEQAINPYLNLRVTRHWWVNNMVWICVITLFHCIILIDFSFIKITQSLTDRRECHNNPISVVLNSTIKTFLVSLPDLTNFILFTIPLPQSFRIKSANKYYTPFHYNDVIMCAMACEITSLTVVYSFVYSDADQRNIKALCYWPLWGEFTGDRTGEFPAQRASNAENVFIRWRHHTKNSLGQGFFFCDLISLTFYKHVKHVST